MNDNLMNKLAELAEQFDKKPGEVAEDDTSMYNTVLNAIEATAPDEFNLCYPRIYHNAGQYGSPKQAAGAMTTCAQWVRSETLRKAPHAAVSIYMATCAAQEFAFPALFVAPELLAAVRRTSPPPDALWTDINLPFEAGVFYLPKNALRHTSGIGVDIVGWARVRSGRDYKMNAPGHVKFTLGEDIFVVWSSLPNSRFELLDSTLNASMSPQISDWHAPEWNNTINTGIGELPMGDDENQFLHNLRALAFGLLLAFDARPDLLSKGARVKGVKTKSGREIWKPNIVGKTFRAQRETVGPQSQHASPRMHWRRGHYRRQRYGVALELIKTVWIQPTLISAELTYTQQERTSV